MLKVGALALHQAKALCSCPCELVLCGTAVAWQVDAQAQVARVRCVGKRTAG